MLTVLKLKVGDLVADDAGNVGKVVGFKRDGVVIDWGGVPGEWTDEQLRECGVVLVGGQ